MPNRPIYSNGLVALRWQKFNLNLRSQSQVRNCKEAHPDIAEIDANCFCLKRLGEYLHRSVQQLALPATPVPKGAFEHHP